MIPNCRQHTPEKPGRGRTSQFTSTPTFLALLVILFAFSVLCIPASADDDYVTVSFEDLNLLGPQMIKVFDADGDLLQTVNTSSYVLLCINETDPDYSTFYTFVFQPTVANRPSSSILGGMMDFLEENYLGVFLLLIIVFALFIIFRRN